MNVSQYRWDRCITHQRNETEEFIDNYFGNESRKILFIAGGGFDPRSLVISKKLVKCASGRIKGVFIREQRRGPSPELLRRADVNISEMHHDIPDATTWEIDIFASDMAVIGGREVARKANQLSLEGVSDIVLDFSALSKGITFPLVRQLYERVKSYSPCVNMHLMVVENPQTDSEIVATGSDKATEIYGFKGGLSLTSNRDAAKLWLPQLIVRQGVILDRIYNFIKPHDVLPILPFPTDDPKIGDRLMEHYASEFENAWDVDARNVIYAAENKPLDLYRTILRINDARERIFKGLNGSLTILTPIGSKVLSIGALMAAIERDFPVVYVEAVGYDVNFAKIDQLHGTFDNIVHVWLHGDVYLPLQ